MFANDRTSNTSRSPITLRVVGSADLRAAPDRQDRLHGSVSPDVALDQPWLSKRHSIELRRCDDEPALEYGCVDWFLYDEPRSQ